MSERKLRLLCLDGGGVRGLSSLYLLQQLMQAANKDNPPKPCNFFDMIGGTSTGGLIAIMLGRLEMSIEDCIEKYISMSDRIFVRKRHRLKLNTDVQGRFDTDELERSIKSIIKDMGLPEDEKMRSQEQIQGGQRFCKVFVCALSGEARSKVQFTNYARDSEMSPDLYNNAKIWEVARATSAASSFFEPITIGKNKRVFLDGAVGANNPIRQLWQEAGRLWGPGHLEPQIQCLVSIGTGVPAVEPFGAKLLAVAKTLKAIATETEETAESFASEHTDIISQRRYLRLNVLKGLESIGLEDASKKSDIEATTEAYGRTIDTLMKLQAFRECVNEAETESPVVEVQVTATISRPPLISAFYTLDQSAKYICNRMSDQYWSHLTKDSLEIYEQIYRDCKSPDGEVRFTNFLPQFAGRYPPAERVKQAWLRLGKLSLTLPKNHVLAIIYMIHIENFLHNALPRSDAPHADDRIIFSNNRNRILDHYGDWVDCSCRCQRQWNFAGGIDGLQKNVNKHRKCKAEEWAAASRLTKWMHKDGAAAYEDNRKKWLGLS